MPPSTLIPLCAAHQAGYPWGQWDCATSQPDTPVCLHPQDCSRPMPNQPFCLPAQLPPSPSTHPVPAWHHAGSAMASCPDAAHHHQPPPCSHPRLPPDSHFREQKLPLETGVGFFPSLLSISLFLALFPHFEAAACPSIGVWVVGVSRAQSSWDGGVAGDPPAYPRAPRGRIRPLLASKNNKSGGGSGSG